MVSVSRSIHAFYAFTILWAFNPTGGLWILYLLHCHWSLFQVGLAEAGFHLVALFAEVPTGLFADRLGRRLSLGVGLAIHSLTLGAMFLLAPKSFALGLLAVSLGSLSWAFIGGADRALLFALVAPQPEKNDFGRAYGRVLALNLLTRALATALGGILVRRGGWGVPYAMAMVSPLLAMGTLVLIAEPRLEHIGRRETWSWTATVESIRQGYRVVTSYPGLWTWVAFGAMIASLVTTNNLYAQSTLVLKGASVSLATLLVAGGELLTAIGSWWGGRLSRTTRPEGMLRWGTRALGIAVAAIGCLPLNGAVMGYFTASGLDGMVDPIYEATLNQMIPDALRATILSLPSAGFSLAMMVIFPIAGWAMEVHHLRLTYVLLGGGIAMTGYLVKRRKASRGVNMAG